MDQRLRQRGWSIHSSEGDNYRSRALSHASEMTEPSLSEAEKLHLLNSAFENNVDDHDNVEPRDPSDRQINLETAGSDSIDEEEDEEDEEYVEMMFGEDGSDDDDNDDVGNGGRNRKSDGGRPRKRQKTGGDDTASTAKKEKGGDSNDGSEGDEGDKKAKAQKKPRVVLTQEKQEQLDFAKNNLSKWAARLFDPNRPRGLVEAPQVIPLNDEFLSAFGKREKEYDELAGREVDVDKTSLDIIDVSDDDDSTGNMKSKKREPKKLNFSEMKNCKVKVTNLAYSTSTAKIASACGLIGPVVDVNLILDDNNQSTGRAYVVFEDEESAMGCVEKMNEKQLDGRTLYMSLAGASSARKKSGGGGGSAKKKDNRYWEHDISIKCNRCGGIGHIEAKCPNEAKPRPCAICAGIDHEMYSCPMKSVCFNCGVPGHMNRDCWRPRGMPRRSVCTICYESGHHRWQCRDRSWVPDEATCMQCGKPGHFMCSEMRWFFGLKGVTCFQCGANDHHGSECSRPDLERCSKNPDLAQEEIEMAEAYSMRELLSSKRKSNNREGRDRSRAPRNDNDRPRSMPPPMNRDNRQHRDDANYNGRVSNGHESRWQDPRNQQTHTRFR